MKHLLTLLLTMVGILVDLDHDSFVRKVLSALEGLSEGLWFYYGYP